MSVVIQHSPKTTDTLENPVYRHLLNDYQRGFPLVSRPYQGIAQRLEQTETDLLEHVYDLQQAGIISRIGPVFKPHSIGASTLAAMSVPEAQLQQVAAIISAYPEVNHNYEREHFFNLWFVVTAENKNYLQQVLAQMEQETGFEILYLPMLKDYHIDLGFDLLSSHQEHGQDHKHQRKSFQGFPQDTVTDFPALDAQQTTALIQAVQVGLPLLSKPYAALANTLGLSEAQVLGTLQQWQRQGIIRRFGIIVRHRKLGYCANAMTVWNIPDKAVDDVANQLGSVPGITLCYQRPRRLPHWSYNLFCMIHGQDRNSVLTKIQHLIRQHDLMDIEHDILFSGRCFKQRGAIYRNSSRCA
ncbi:siroheme decarboxylase subunit beta [Candidatus Venteria ishoeyi]|uniref:siroheme decarboxylase n=1 Tax=Candidatus Venteria ishoeyi TaxID=1899563 RepID=A0A1H6FG49_9GAMM|nr:Lrp/AsnC family transcriptional regulator [Candidatus Venteria ishoeyi]MDM8546118.1 hypothetical protein [Candidatus Venteria ishoeyi]SEH07984.1 Uncharacterised protein [Candidatus Venteria ishoeyi]